MSECNCNGRVRSGWGQIRLSLPFAVCRLVQLLLTGFSVQHSPILQEMAYILFIFLCF